MKKETAQEHIKLNLIEGDSLISFFQAVQPIKIWLFFLIGPLAVLSMKMYFLAVTEKGLYFHRLSLLGKFNGFDFFAYDEIESVVIGKGVLQRPMKFQFRNGRTLKIKAQLKGVEKIAKLTSEAQQHIELNIAQAQ